MLLRQRGRMLSASSSSLFNSFNGKAMTVLLLCFVLVSTSTSTSRGGGRRQYSNFGATAVHAIPMVLVETHKPTCYDIDAIRDTIFKIQYQAPDMNFDDTHPIATANNKAYISVTSKPHNRVYDTDLHHAPIRDRLKPMAHTITKAEDTLYHTMEVDGTAQICIRATTTTGQPMEHAMVFGLRVTTSDEEPELLRMKERDAKPANIDGHLTHVEMEFRRITTALDTVLKEAGHNQERDTKFHQQTREMHSATTFWPIVQKIQVKSIPRQQFIQVQPVKTHGNGTFVTDRDIQLNDNTFNKNKKNNKYSKHQGSSYSKSASYKGPDTNGHYLSYAIVLQDGKEEDPLSNNNRRSIGMIDVENPDNNINDNDTNVTNVPEVDLQLLLPFMEKVIDDSGDNNNNQQQRKYRLIPKSFGARHSQRRVRAMVNKIETYIRNRRYKLVIIEAASPAWQGIVLIVIGSVTILITCTLGQFTNDTYNVTYRGPGVTRTNNSNFRREQLLQKHNPSPSTMIAKRKVTLQTIHQIATPSQYEVSTTAATSRPSTTTTKHLPPTSNTTTTNMQANPNLNYRKAVASAHARSRITQ